MKADNSCAKAARDSAVAKRISTSIAMVDTRFFAAPARTLSHARSRMARAASPTRYPMEKVSRCSAGDGRGGVRLCEFGQDLEARRAKQCRSRIDVLNDLDGRRHETY